MESTLTDDFRIKTIEARLGAIAEASKSARFAFVVCVVISSALGLVEWNAFLSNNRDLAAPLPTVSGAQGLDEPVAALRQSIRSLWVESTFVTVPLLNVRIGVNDAAVLGSLTLFIVSMWWYWCVRRENQGIGTLLLDTYNDKELRPFIFHTIADSALILTDHMNGPFRSVREAQANTASAPPSMARRMLASARLLLWPLSSRPRERKREIDLYGRFLSVATASLVFLPSVAGMGLVIGDVSSLFTPSLFVSPGRTASQVLGPSAIASYALVNWVPGLVFVLLTTRNCAMIRYYRSGTEAALREYGAITRESEAVLALRQAVVTAVETLGDTTTLTCVTETIGECQRGPLAT